MQDSHPSFYYTETWYHLHTFLIHSGSLQNMLTALFNLVWNAQKNEKF